MRRVNRGFSILIPCLLVLALQALGNAQVAARADQATERATAFATSLGVTWGDNTEAKLCEDASPNSTQKAKWSIELGQSSKVEVDPRTGVIVGALDLSAAEVHDHVKRPVALDQTAAVDRANEILKLAGLTQVLTLGTPTVRLGRSEPGVWEYTIYFAHQYKGIPYQCGVAVCLASEDGKLIYLSAGLDVPVPASTAVTTDEDTAKASALGYASQLAPSAAETATASAKLMIVLPNSYWTAKGLGAKEDGTVPRVAWVVTENMGGGRLIFTIDAADGRLLGGTQSKGFVGTGGVGRVPGSSPSSTASAGPGRLDRGAFLRLLDTVSLAARLLSGR